MTSREWQHALYFRDRWTPTPQLTLDLGLRWEFYPIMHRADGRGLDRLDISNPVFARQLDVLIAGRGQNPQTNGMKAGLDNFAPRLGAAYRINDLTVVRTGYGITYNAQAWARAVRGDNDYPVTVASTFLNAEAYQPYATLDQGIPKLLGPDLSSGRVPLDRAAAVYTPEIDNIDRGYIHTWNAAFQRLLPFTTDRRRGLCRRQGRRRLCGAGHQRAHEAGRRRCEPAVRVAGTPRRDQFMGTAAEDGLQLAAGRVQQAVHARVHAEGRLHARQSHERKRQRRPRHAPVQHAERAWSQLGAGRIRPAAQPAGRVRLRAAVAEQRQRLWQHRQGARQRLADQRHVRRVLR